MRARLVFAMLLTGVTAACGGAHREADPAPSASARASSVAQTPEIPEGAYSVQGSLVETLSGKKVAYHPDALISRSDPSVGWKLDFQMPDQRLDELIVDFGGSGSPRSITDFNLVVPGGSFPVGFAWQRLSPPLSLNLAVGQMSTSRSRTRSGPYVATFVASRPDAQTWRIEDVTSPPFPANDISPTRFTLTLVKTASSRLRIEVVITAGDGDTGAADLTASS